MLKGLFKKKTPVEKFMTHLDRIFQTEPEYYKEESETNGIAGVTSIVYKDIPEKGMITGITYGLSLGNHPDWKLGRPELIITVDSKDASWAQVAGYLANSLRGNCPFSYSNTINFREKISDESEMDAFLVFAPSILDKKDFANIDIGLNYKINIAGLYPIYASEMEYIDKNGLEKFWKHPNFDMYNVNRKRIK
ncbi:suppressor of fused domain protein [Oceanihabitans sp. IOP_32]|uniref:suppressor of fused domain protein n=1 Tax=Oceanihabitans sp. IOP_32 TaxID=2529032 RepID=UPI001D1721B4|nr:suppressor of fused domain protein [Oceanihabitans sp. IOP_32]